MASGVLDYTMVAATERASITYPVISCDNNFVLVAKHCYWSVGLSEYAIYGTDNTVMSASNVCAALSSLSKLF